MAFEKIKLFGKIEFELSNSVTDALVLLTDMPGNAMAARVTLAVAAQGRSIYRSRLPYNMQGHLIQLQYTPGAGQTTLYAARVWGRELPDGEWQWFDLPVVATPTEYSPMELPIPPTSNEWTAAALPIPPTSDAYTPANLPIPPTPDEYTPANLPIPRTPDEYTPIGLPIKPTAPVGQWSDVGMSQ